MENRTEVINWFLSLSREVFMNPNGVSRKEMNQSGLESWSSFETRMKEIADEIGVRYVTYSLVKRGEGGKWFYTPQGFYLWVMANMPIIARVGEFKPVVDTWNTCQETSLRVSKIEGSRRMKPERIQEKADREMRRNYRQIKMIWADVPCETPLYNMGVKN